MGAAAGTAAQVAGGGVSPLCDDDGNPFELLISESRGHLRSNGTFLGEIFPLTFLHAHVCLGNGKLWYSAWVMSH